MTTNYEIASKEGITVITMLYEATRDDLIGALHKIVASDAYERRLWDFTRVEFNFSIEEMRQVSDVSKSLIDRLNKVAFAVGDPLAYGKMRQFKGYRAGELTIPGVFIPVPRHIPGWPLKMNSAPS